MENQCQMGQQCNSQPPCPSGPSCSQPSCAQPSCQPPACQSMCGCPACEMVGLAKEAKMNVLIRKMEAAIEKEYGPVLDKEAKLLVQHFFKMKRIKHEKKSAIGDEMGQFHEQIMALWKQ